MSSLLSVTSAPAPKNRKFRWLKFGFSLAFLPLFTGAAMGTVSATLTPSSITSNSTTPVVLHVTGLTTGQAVIVERFVDPNANGIIDAGDVLGERFTVTDGQVPSIGGVRNPNLPGDEDGAADSQISTHLTPALGPELARAAGAQLIRISSPTSAFPPFTETLTITQPAFAQSFTGNVTDGCSPVPFAGVVLLDASNKNGKYVCGVIADASGHFTINAPAGSYQLAAFKSGFVTSFNSCPVTLGDGATVPADIVVGAATTTLSGNITDVGNSAGLGGVQLFLQADNGDATSVSTNADGTYSVPVTAGQWQIEVSEASISALGYLLPQHQNNNGADISADTSGGPATGANLALPKITALIYGTIKDNLNNPVIGVQASANDQANLYNGKATSIAPDGNYVVGALAGNWSVGVSSDDLPAGYTIGNGANVTLIAGQAVSANLTLRLVTAHLRGQHPDDHRRHLGWSGQFHGQRHRQLDHQLQLVSQLRHRCSVNSAKSQAAGKKKAPCERGWLNFAVRWWLRRVASPRPRGQSPE